jgi:hypothetical protein
MPAQRTYEIANYLGAVECSRLALREQSGSLSHRGALPVATTSANGCASSSMRPPAVGRSGAGARVELKAIDPRSPSVRWRSRCAPSVTVARRSYTAEGAEGHSILRAEEGWASILEAEGSSQGRCSRAQGWG